MITVKARHKSIRSIVAVILVIATVLGFGVKLYDIQITNNNYYEQQNSAVSKYNVQIEAARGKIVDRNGNVLVTNRQGNSIIIDAAYFPSAKENEARNEIILNLIAVFEKNGEEWAQNLPLKITKKGKIAFKTDKDSKKEIITMKSKDMLNLQHYATAQNCFDAMVEKYGLESFDKKTALKIGNIRYELTRMLFSIDNPVSIAEDVSDLTVAEIKEGKEKFLGADVKIVAYREYEDSTIAPHILGTVRKINAEEYSQLKDKGYKITDEIGESGIEKAMEEQLRGVPGEKTITIDTNGNVHEEITKEPIQGNTVVLTIDKNLQVVAQNSIKSACDKVSLASSAGAVVVEDCNSGEVLAAASYPSYDLNDYYEKYEQLSKNPRNPLWSRFALGAYAPGSTFKPAMAAAALQEGVINSSTTFYCSSVFKYYDQEFGCLDAHGYQNVDRSLRNSCNIFYYNVATKLGINKMNHYAAMFGLGEKTGVEIPESTGILAGPAEREAAGRLWLGGDTVQAAIGQSDNLFTPLQLCNYSATIANGGTRYQMHFVKAIISSADGTVTQKESKILDTIEISSSNLNLVHKGMRAVAVEGNVNTVFNSKKYTVACKTGTSQVIGANGAKRNNGFLITFAPYKNPEISVASVVELAGSGTETASATADILNYYYSNSPNAKKAQKTGTLLD